MKINGWTLALANIDGVRVWRHESGRVEVKGIDGMNADQISNFIDWMYRSLIAGESVPVEEIYGQLTAEDLAALIELDADTFLETADA